MSRLGRLIYCSDLGLTNDLLLLVGWPSSSDGYLSVHCVPHVSFAENPSIIMG